MKIILYNNIFEFHDSLWKLNIGATMGSKPIPHYANTFMANIDKKIRNLAPEEALKLFKRFQDDFFLIYLGSTKELHALVKEFNKIHPT